MTGRIVGGFGERFEVLCEDGVRTICSVRGNLKRNTVPLVGDFVEIEGHDTYSISAVLERKNSLIRPPIANIDKLFCVTATCSPSPSLETLDKICCAACAKGIEPIVVINKTDLKSGEEIEAVYSRSNIKVYPVCAQNGEGIESLKAEAVGTCAFAGASGVGKSSLLNALFPELCRKVGSVSEKIQRGKHTTRTVELFAFEKGFIADTPGFGLVDFEHFDFLSLEELPSSFPEFRKYIGKCRYSSCTHTKETECAIVEAVANGSIAKSRHDSYVAMYNVLKEKKKYGASAHNDKF